MIEQERTRKYRARNKERAQSHVVRVLTENVKVPHICAAGNGSDDEKWPRLICCELFNNGLPSEKWTQCTNCKNWAREKCAPGGDSLYAKIVNANALHCVPSSYNKFAETQHAANLHVVCFFWGITFLYVERFSNTILLLFHLWNISTVTPYAKLVAIH